MLYLKRLIKSNPSILKMIIDYCLYPLRTTHADHLKRFLGEENSLLQQLTRKSVHYEKIVNRFFMMSPGISQDLGNFDLQEKRLLLMDGDFLEKAVFATGIAICSRGIAREVRGDRVRRLKEHLDQKWYLFALKKALFFFASLDVEVPLPHDLSDFPRECFFQGFSVWKRVLEPTGATSFESLLTRFPPDLADVGRSVSPFPLPQEKAFNIVKRVVKNLEGGSRWLSLLE
jgi:hypothetical protein